MINKGMRAKLTTKQFIKRANQTHGDLYDYSKVKYKNAHTKVCIIDSEYGEFYQSPHSHLAGCGNPGRGIQKIKNKLSMTTNEFIEKANKVHNNFYDYSKVVYKGSQIKVYITDPEFGEFYQKATYHLSGHGCPDRKRGGRLTTGEFIDRAKKVHGDLYDYSKVEYKHAHTKICIIDPIYGKFYQTPVNHLGGQGCPDRSYNGENSIHKDHIIPLSIIGRHNKNRPLYKLLNGDINIQKILGNENNKKSDWIEYNGKNVRARDVKNNYKIIAYLSKKLLKINIDTIIKEDKIFVYNQQEQI